MHSQQRATCSQVASMDNMIARQREIVAKHIRGENEHDWPAVYDTFVHDDRAHYEVVPLGTVFKWH
jgi:hypothetical protein